MNGVHFFSDELSLKNYIAVHNVYSWYGSVGLGRLRYISAPQDGLFVVFDSVKDYDLWLRLGKPVMIQESLFNI
jgi:hypothetical protein